MKKNEYISDLWDNIIQPKVRVIEVSEGGKSEDEKEKYFERIIVKIF